MNIQPLSVTIKKLGKRPQIRKLVTVLLIATLSLVMSACSVTTNENEPPPPPAKTFQIKFFDLGSATDWNIFINDEKKASGAFNAATIEDFSQWLTSDNDTLKITVNTNGTANPTMHFELYVDGAKVKTRNKSYTSADIEHGFTFSVNKSTGDIVSLGEY